MREPTKRETQEHTRFYRENLERKLKLQPGEHVTDARLRKILQERVRRFGAGVLEPFENRLLERLS